MDFELPAQTWFEKPVEKLTRHLHGFFQRRILAARQARALRKTLPPPDPHRDFQEFVSWFAEAIREFELPSEALLPSDSLSEYPNFDIDMPEASSILILNPSDGEVQTRLNLASKRPHDGSAQPELEPLRKKFRVEMDIGLEGEQAVGVFSLALTEITWI